jgi:hypothetical protein
LALWQAWTVPDLPHNCLPRGLELRSASISAVTCYGCWYWPSTSCKLETEQRHQYLGREVALDESHLETVLPNCIHQTGRNGDQRLLRGTTLCGSPWWAISPSRKGWMIMELRISKSLGSSVEPLIGLALCVAVLLSMAMGHLVSNRPAHAQSFAPDWLPLAAVGFAATGIMRLDGSPRWLRVQRVLRWTGLLLMVWVANGLPFDLFAMAGLIGDPATGRPIRVDWPEMATRTLALSASLVLTRLALARPAAPSRVASWYGFAAFVLALPYPVLRMH